MGQTKYIKLISKSDEYYDEGTEVFNYDGHRFTVDEWYKAVTEGGLLCRGYVDGEQDGDLCHEQEFIFEIVDDNKWIDRDWESGKIKI